MNRVILMVASVCQCEVEVANRAAMIWRFLTVRNPRRLTLPLGPRAGRTCLILTGPNRKCLICDVEREVSDLRQVFEFATWSHGRVMCLILTGPMVSV